VRVLALDTATAGCSVAACDGDLMLAQCCEPMRTGQAERIVPMLAEVTAEACWSFADPQLIATTLGPGSFTGIRAGLAAARALALATGIPAIGLSTLEAMAATVPPGVPVVCVIAGRQGSVFAQRFPGGEPQICREADIAELRRPGDLLLVNGGTGLEGVVSVRLDGLAVARAAIRQLEQGRRPGPGTALRPLYLRDSGARPEAGRPLVRAA
jgi:tRNA threonylcarbamoyladenosine biosynthesis protein TsaB